ncbi:MAG: hypothetical protein JO127_05920 [Caulobacteraceae bacterium]|nr:hypothetical protein [Caulobacteraceae bacterium]
MNLKEILDCRLTECVELGGSMGRRLALGMSASLVCLSIGALSASKIQAATTTAADQPAAANLEQVVVTARRRSENLQRVPIAVTAIGGGALTAKGISNVTELARQVPNVSIAGASTNPQLLTVGVRGIRQKEGHPFFDPSVVTIYADSVVAHPTGSATPCTTSRASRYSRVPRERCSGATPRPAP